MWDRSTFEQILNIYEMLSTRFVFGLWNPLVCRVVVLENPECRQHRGPLSHNSRYNGLYPWVPWEIEYSRIGSSLYGSGLKPGCGPVRIESLGIIQVGIAP